MLVFFEGFCKLLSYNRLKMNSRLAVSRLVGSRLEGLDPRSFSNYYVSEREIESWKMIFDEFDTDNDGVLAPRDLL